MRQKFGGYVRLPIDERREVVAELAEEGLSQREIAAVVGVSHKTVDRDLGVSNDTPEEEPPRVSVDSSAPLVSNDTPDEDEWWDDGAILPLWWVPVSAP